MPWTPLFSIGIREIDEQHKTLFRLANEFDAAAREGRGVDMVERTLDDLIAYADVHFETEEKLMRRYQFAASASHEAEHAKLRSSVADFRRRIHEGNDDVVPDLLTFLRDWLTRHIMNSDRQLGIALNRKGIR